MHTPNIHTMLTFMAKWKSQCQGATWYPIRLFQYNCWGGGDWVISGEKGDLNISRHHSQYMDNRSGRN